MTHAVKSVALLSLVAVVQTLGCEEEKATAPVEAKPTASAIEASKAPPQAATAAPVKAEPQKAKEQRSLAECPTGNSVDFPNADFEAAVRRKLVKPTGEIKRADLAKLTSLNVSQIRLVALDVCVFPQMTGLKELFLGAGSYSDLSPISGATRLESLRAAQNQVTDLSPLQKMTHLDRLDLGQTEVSDLKPLSGLVNLTELMLDNTQVADLTPLSGMTKLERVSLKNSKVTDLKVLAAAKKLKFVYVAGTPAADTSFEALLKNGTKIITE